MHVKSCIEPFVISLFNCLSTNSKVGSYSNKTSDLIKGDIVLNAVFQAVEVLILKVKHLLGPVNPQFSLISLDIAYLTYRVLVFALCRQR